MSGYKRRLGIAIILLIIIIGIFTLFVDFSRFLGLYDFYKSYPNELIKRFNVLLAAALVWLAGKESLNKYDNSTMKLVFAVVFVGEAFFLLAKPAYAIIAFFVCQYLLTMRNGSSLFQRLSKATLSQKLKLTAAAIMLAGIIAATVISLYPFEGYFALSLVGITYWVMLSISVWTALANFILCLFPKANSRMVAIGMICFYFCDICVGLDGILSGGNLWLLANSLIWVFYTPAITLLALSCYKYEARYKTRALK